VADDHNCAVMKLLSEGYSDLGDVSRVNEIDQSIKEDCQ
jgi:hypothetical protein